ncbi:MAG: D-alanyl-D-alanine carboxypeptidase/D-alanyl-D-alanine-endopeptidase [Paludibacter sp.]|jgi:D-alanyl-D-alanine carboxypeptidase/D-alanyl-D-alanine-endopeptidase (penicillin-binding protein 4)|nr:D-alanyl-D-alanine carboxypeptidase/D-alanyl-D-alanine-endopeptidase [Paludibacter sp.]
MKKFLIFSLAFSSVLFAFSKNPIEIFTNNANLKQANISILVQDAKTDKTLFQHRADKVATPASTMKLVTTATALEIFGADFRFKTLLAYDGQISADSVLTGNLYITGSGDPTLGSSKIGDANFFEDWVKALRTAGIKNIKGKIVAEENIFDRQAANPQWTWQDMGNAYAPGIHSISYMDNTLRVFFETKAVGSTPTILRTEPQVDGMQFYNYLKATNVSTDKGYFYGEPFSLRRTIYGEIPANRAEFSVKTDMPHPANLLVKHFTEKLQKNGFSVKNDSIPASNKKLIYTHLSPPLSEIIAETNKKSNNHYAECLFRLIGTQAGTPATIESSLKIILNYWRTRNLPVSQLFQNDGSGLSPNNAVSAEFFVALLNYMRTKSKYSTEFYQSLAVSGESGTLEPMLRKTVLKGKVHAKSGTLTSVKSYAGYVDYKDKSLIFCVIVNNFHGSSYDVLALVEEFLLNISE